MPHQTRAMDCLREYQMTNQHFFFSWASYEPAVAANSKRCENGQEPAKAIFRPF
jgi:hypothetical protein